jgi:hypothetical protein
MRDACPALRCGTCFTDSAGSYIAKTSPHTHLINLLHGFPRPYLGGSRRLPASHSAYFVAPWWRSRSLRRRVVAEKAADGSALAGGLMKQDGKLNFVVVIANGDRLKEVMLEPPRVGRGRTNRH